MDREHAFRWLFATEYQGVVRTVWLVIRDKHRAEDIAQEALVQLLRKWDKIGTYESPEALAVVRSPSARRSAPPSATAESPSAKCACSEKNRSLPTTEPDPTVLAAVSSLSPQQRSVVVLFYFEDRPMAEIADILGCSASTGWVHLHRARRRLAGLLGEEVPSDVG